MILPRSIAPRYKKRKACQKTDFPQNAERQITGYMGGGNLSGEVMNFYYSQSYICKVIIPRLILYVKLYFPKSESQ